MLAVPRSGSKVWEALDREIGKSGENRGQIIAHWEFQPAAAFHDRENRRNLRSRLWTGDVYPVLPAQSHGTYGIFRKVIAQLKFRIFQESGKFPPQCERVLAGPAYNMHWRAMQRTTLPRSCYEYHPKEAWLSPDAKHDGR